MFIVPWSRLPRFREQAAQFISSGIKEGMKNLSGLDLVALLSDELWGTPGRKNLTGF